MIQPGFGWTALLGWYLAAVALSSLLVPLCRMAAFRLGYVAKPRQDRWHSRPTAMLGGVGIAVTVLLLAVVAGDVGPIALTLVCGALIFAVGLIDDLLSLKPSTKLIAQIALAAVFVFFGERLHWADGVPLLDMALTIAWLVGVTNAFNLLDNMDGLCAGVALIAGVALLLGLAGRADVLPAARYLALLLGATTGFLFYNAHPASIFMGDAGSLFLGLTLSALTLSVGGQAHDRSHVLSIVAAPMLVLLIPIFDTTLVTFSRLWSGRSVSTGGRDHSSHRLVAIGLSERSAVGVLWTLAALGGATGYALRQFADQGTWLLGALFLLAMALFAAYLAQVRVYDEPANAPASSVTPVIVNFMYKRRVAEVVLDVCLVSIAYYAAWRLRFEGVEWATYFPSLVASLPIAIAVQMIALFVFGAYRGAWRHFGLMDGVVFGKAVASGTVTLIAAIAYLYRFQNYSRGVFIIYAAVSMLLLCGSRASFRLIGEFVRRRRTGTRLIIYGAGSGGSLLVRELLGTGGQTYQMLGFIDDDPAKHSFRLQGYPVLGGERKLLELVDKGSVDVVVIGTRGLDPERAVRLHEACERGHITLQRLSLRIETLVSPA